MASPVLRAPFSVKWPLPSLPRSGTNSSAAYTFPTPSLSVSPDACYLEGRERPAAGLLGVQGQRCPVGVTVASGLRPGDTSPGGAAGAETQQHGGVLEGNPWPTRIPLAPQSIPAGTLLCPKLARTPAVVGQPCPQKLVEGLVPGLALLRAMRSVSGYKGLRRVDRLR